MNCTGAFVLTTAVGVPLALAGATSVLAASTASLPDQAEKVLRIPKKRHRQNPTHYPSVQILFFALLAVGGCIWVPEFAALIVFACAGGALGCVLHSVADAMTIEPQGIKLAWPISKRGYHLMPYGGRVRVDSKSRSERLFVIVWMALVLYYAYRQYGSFIFA